MAQPGYTTILTGNLSKARLREQTNGKHPRPRFTERSRASDEVAYFSGAGLTDAELAQYARRTAKRPLLCFLTIAASPFITEGLCRLLGAW